MSELGDYESADVIRSAVQGRLLQYMEYKFLQQTERDSSSVNTDQDRERILDTDAIGEFQLSTYVDSEDDHFGHALALSPLHDDEEGQTVRAIYLKGNRVTSKPAEEPILLTLTLPATEDDSVMDESRPADSSDYVNILRLLTIAWQRTLEPEKHQLDPIMKMIMTERVLGRLALMYGDRKVAGVTSEQIEDRLNFLFIESTNLFEDEGDKVLAIKGKGGDGQERYMLVERDENDYIVCLLDKLQAGTPYKFAVGPYAADKAEEHYVDTKMPAPQDMANINLILQSSEPLTADEFQAARALEKAFTKKAIKEDRDIFMDAVDKGDYPNF